MAEEFLLEQVHFFTSMFLVLFYTALIFILIKKNAGVIKARIFLRYNLFKLSFYVMFAGALILLAGHSFFMAIGKEIEIVDKLIEGTFFILVSIQPFILFYVLKEKKKW